MKFETIMKRIEGQRKEIKRHEKEIAHYKKEWCADGCPEGMKEQGRKWIAYYEQHIERVEKKIAEMLKQAAEIATEEEENEMISVMAKEMEEKGVKMDGTTAKGLRYSIFWNSGITKRSRHCYSMAIEGMGVVFTSGTIETVARYILKN